MKHVWIVLCAGILFLGGCSTQTGIEVSEAWARPAAQGGNGAIYFLLQNHATSPDELTGISSDAAQAVEIHESTMENDVMQMRQVGSIAIESRADVEFRPGGYHVMLIGLTRDLKAGDEIEVTFHFKENEDIRLSIPVQEE